MCLRQCHSFLSLGSKVYLLCALLTVCAPFLVRDVSAFNVDTVNYVKHDGDRDSMFGFTVAAHRERGNSWVLVGAPEAQSRESPSNVIKGGAVFRCAINSDNNCQELPFDKNGHNFDKNGKQIDTKSHQWFGATLHTGGPDSQIVACAPRYTWFASSLNRRDPVGTCYVSAPDFTDFSEYSPCRTRLWGYHRQGSCQAGFGAAISQKGNRVFIGAPGSWYWQGQIFQQSLESRPTVLWSQEGSAVDDDSYMGYSVAVGDFTGEGEQGVAVGMPRGASLFGKVILYTWNLTNYQNITGQQLGSYFGYAIAASDVDGDGKDDLVIGAPMYTIPNNEGKYEVGRVYVVYQGNKANEGAFRQVHTLDGINSKSRFGLALASLGDINNDGFGDFAVGAPYDGKFERGAVYIYHGSFEGVREKYSQVIRAEDVGVSSFGTFGFSIAGGVDLDGNDYPDMVVGAYLSDSAHFFRARPVVKIDAFVRYLTGNKQISLEERNCTLRNVQKVPCTSIDFCIKYSGKGVPDSIDMDLQFVLDSKKSKDPRMYFLANEGQHSMNETWTLNKDQNQVCKPKFVYIKNDIKDKLTSLEAEVRYSMRQRRHVSYEGVRSGNAPLAPILDLNTPTFRKDAIIIQKNCGSDNICIPDLKLIAQPNVKRYLLGSNEPLEFDVIVENHGEDSFESTYSLHIPPGMNFKRVVEDDKPEIRVHCPSVRNNTIKCEIGNPLPRDKIVHFKIVLDPYHKEGMKPSYDFSMTANSTNPEDPRTTTDNKMDVSVHIWVDSELALEGSSIPPEVHYNASYYSSETIKTESEIGPQVVHIYGIRNNGPSDIIEADIFLMWPYATLSGEDLLYLLEQPETEGPIYCEYANANYKKYELDSRKKSYLKASGVIGSTSELTATNVDGKGGSSVTIEEKGSKSSSSSSGGITSSSSSSTSYHHSGGSSSGGGINKLKHKKYEDDLIGEGGDGSLVHQNRRKEYQAGISGGRGSAEGSYNRQHQTESTSRGSEGSYAGSQQHAAGTASGGRVETHHSSSTSNRTSVGGGPIVTHGWVKNTTTWTGPDGVQHHRESSSTTGGGRTSGSGRVIYSSSGSRTGQENRNRQWGEESSSQATTGEERRYSSSGQITGGQTVYGQERHHQEGQAGGSIQYVNGSYPGSPRAGSVSKYFTWNGRPRGGQNSEEQATREDSRRQQQGYGSHDERHRQTGYGHHEERRTESEGGRGHTEGSSGHHNVQNRFEQGSTATQTNSSGGHRIMWTTDSQGNIVSTSNQQGGAVSGGTEYAGSKEEDADGEGDEYYDEDEDYSETGGNLQGLGGQGTGGSAHGRDGSQTHTQTASSSSNHGQSNTNSQTAAGSGRDRSTYGKYDQTQGGRINYENTGIGAAALGGGFKTTALDLGALGNANVDEEVTRHSESNFGRDNDGRAFTTRTRVDPDLGTAYEERVYSSGGGYGAHDARQGQGSRTFSGGSSRTYSTSREEGGGSREGGTSVETSERSYHRSGTGGSRYETRSESRYSSGGGSSSTSGAHHERYKRHKRQAQEDPSDWELEQSLTCNATRCLTLKCTVGPLKKDHEAWIALRTRVNARTLKNITWSQPVTLSTMMLARISKLPYIGTPLDRNIHSHEVFTTVSSPETDIRPDVVPLWVVVLSACAGAIILLLLIFLLYKCGFFKRNRPSDAPERQPLNRNGHYQNGDEQL